MSKRPGGIVLRSDWLKAGAETHAGPGGLIACG